MTRPGSSPRSPEVPFDHRKDLCWTEKPSNPLSTTATTCRPTQTPRSAATAHEAPRLARRLPAGKHPRDPLKLGFGREILRRAARQDRPIPDRQPGRRPRRSRHGCRVPPSFLRADSRHGSSCRATARSRRNRRSNSVSRQGARPTVVRWRTRQPRSRERPAWLYREVRVGTCDRSRGGHAVSLRPKPASGARRIEEATDRDRRQDDPPDVHDLSAPCAHTCAPLYSPSPNAVSDGRCTVLTRKGGDSDHGNQKTDCGTGRYPRCASVESLLGRHCSPVARVARPAESVCHIRARMTRSANHSRRCSPPEVNSLHTDSRRGDT